MTKQEAYRQMVLGKKIRHANYGPEEYIWFDGCQIRDEAGYHMGTRLDEFWTVYQNWEEGWEICVLPSEEQIIIPMTRMENHYVASITVPVKTSTYRHDQIVVNQLRDRVVHTSRKKFRREK